MKVLSLRGLCRGMFSVEIRTLGDGVQRYSNICKFIPLDYKIGCQIMYEWGEETYDRMVSLQT